MKKFLLSFVTFLMFLPLSALADKVIISGSPVVTTYENDVYVAPKTVTTTSNGYYYFTMGDSKRVCYTEANPALASIDAGIFSFKLGSDTVSLHCYDYSPEYFIVR